MSCRKCSISGRITCSRRFATRCVPGGLGSRPVRWNSNAGKSKFLIAESDPGPRGNMGQPWWGGSRIHPKHPKAHVGSIFNSGGLVRHQDFWIILPWILWNFCTYVCTCLSPVFFVTGVLVLSCTVFFQGFDGFLLSFLEVSPFRVCFVFLCAGRCILLKSNWSDKHQSTSVYPNKKVGSNETNIQLLRKFEA